MFIYKESENDQEHLKSEKICEIHESTGIEVNEEFQSIFFNALNSRYVLCILKDKIHLQGSIKLRLIAGKIDIFGYQPEKNESMEIFSPRGYSNLFLTPIICGEEDENNSDCTVIDKQILKDLRINLMEFDSIREFYNRKTDALIILERNERKEIQMIQNYMKENIFIDFTTLRKGKKRIVLNSSEIILQCLLMKENSEAIQIDSQWNEISIENKSKILIIGGKNVGKSTLLRYLINKNLKKFKKFLLIDLDIGQPECFIPQTVSVTVIDRPLLGPGYLYNMKPIKSLLYGETNCVLSPLFYMKNVQELINYCHELRENNQEFQNVPWIINTMGYNKGFGSELISTIVQNLKPTDIVQLQSKKEINNFDYIMTSDVIKTIPKYLFTNNDEHLNEEYQKHRLILLDSMVQDNENSSVDAQQHITARDKRYEMIIAHCGSILNETNDLLTDVSPYVANLNDLKIICLENMKYSKTDIILNVINSNFVYLCGENLTTTKSEINCIECFGLAICRKIESTDNDNKKIYIITPISLNSLAKVNVLVSCKIPLPSKLLLNQGPKIDKNYIAPYLYTTSDFIASRHIHQIYYKPRSITPKTIQRFRGKFLKRKIKQR